MFRRAQRADQLLRFDPWRYTEGGARTRRAFARALAEFIQGAAAAGGDLVSDGRGGDSRWRPATWLATGLAARSLQLAGDWLDDRALLQRSGELKDALERGVRGTPDLRLRRGVDLVHALLALADEGLPGCDAHDTVARLSSVVLDRYASVPPAALVHPLARPGLACLALTRAGAACPPAPVPEFPRAGEAVFPATLDLLAWTERCLIDRDLDGIAAAGPTVERLFLRFERRKCLLEPHAGAGGRRFGVPGASAALGCALFRHAALAGDHRYANAGLKLVEYLRDASETAGGAGAVPGVDPVDASPDGGWPVWAAALALSATVLAERWVSHLGD